MPVAPWPVVGLLAVAAGAALTGARLLWRARTNPARRERQRRQWLLRHGRTGEAMVNDCQDHLLHYTYSLGGVSYEASQDISHLQDQVPSNPALVIGPALIKYAPRNPGNSIVLSEDWSGLRRTRAGG